MGRPATPTALRSNTPMMLRRRIIGFLSNIGRAASRTEIYSHLHSSIPVAELYPLIDLMAAEGVLRLVEIRHRTERPGQAVVTITYPGYRLVRGGGR